MRPQDKDEEVRLVAEGRRRNNLLDEDEAEARAVVREESELEQFNVGGVASLAIAKLSAL